MLESTGENAGGLDVNATNRRSTATPARKTAAGGAIPHLPTPFEDVQCFAARLNRPRVFIKRDDCTGMVMGGNKTRHNEFLLGAALQSNADCLVWVPARS